ncbi:MULTISPECIES: gas vesicle protein GvpA [Halococcus]|uniref:Gas vesicle protein A n=1 Tax=Halococcus thailandensis JCM 13552 TaxID=1227457 RepID=M0N827_9EURY|nr:MULTISPECIES: gas vesicle structural protein GvpA [Halococcus]EMA54092.1 gas vesicle synthesis protein GvpA [Halococcus thailandensis JCM 13552]
MSARPSSDSLAEVLDRILDKGIVIDVWARVSVVGIEILTVEARIVAASVDTFLHYAKEISKLEMATESGDLEDLKDLDLGTSPMTQPEPDEPEVRIEEDAEQ